DIIPGAGATREPGQPGGRGGRQKSAAVHPGIVRRELPSCYTRDTTVVVTIPLEWVKGCRNSRTPFPRGGFRMSRSLRTPAAAALVALAVAVAIPLRAQDKPAAPPPPTSKPIDLVLCLDV